MPASPAGNLKQAYVSNSRFRESQMIYTSDREAARDAMMRLADRKLALEMVEPVQTETSSPRRSWRSRWATQVTPSVRDSRGMSIEVYPGDRPLTPPPPPTWGEIAPVGKTATVLRVALPDRWMSFPVDQFERWEHEVGEPELLTIRTD